ncbi:MAG: ATP12 family chaperone protein [Rhodospirillaceae bacterium]|nr:ATP12 family chaperone protein [Rhodospirillaceae bacterium]
MKRFYKAASIDQSNDGFGVLLDGRPVRTPGGAPVRVTSKRLAEALSHEWSAQAETINPLSMPMTQLTNTAMDLMADVREDKIAELVRYGNTDLVCYRAERPQTLVATQEAQWQPLLDWLRQHHDINLKTFTGVLPQPQDSSALTRLRETISSYDDFALMALYMGATSAGSVVISLAMMENALTAEAAADAAQVDDRHQIQTWGPDEEAAARLARSREDIETAWRFRSLLTAA